MLFCFWKLQLPYSNEYHWEEGSKMTAQGDSELTSSYRHQIYTYINSNSSWRTEGWWSGFSTKKKKKIDRLDHREDSRRDGDNNDETLTLDTTDCSREGEHEGICTQIPQTWGTGEKNSSLKSNWAMKGSILLTLEHPPNGRETAVALQGHRY